MGNIVVCAVLVVLIAAALIYTIVQKRRHPDCSAGCNACRKSCAYRVKPDFEAQLMKDEKKLHEEQQERLAQEEKQ